MPSLCRVIFLCFLITFNLLRLVRVLLCLNALPYLILMRFKALY